MPSLNQFSAWIECDGVRLPEYSIENSMSADGAMEVNCWVPSEIGKCFEVMSLDSERTYATSHRIFVDGQKDYYHYRIPPTTNLDPTSPAEAAGDSPSKTNLSPERYSSSSPSKHPFTPPSTSRVHQHSSPPLTNTTSSGSSTSLPQLCSSSSSQGTRPHEQPQPIASTSTLTAQPPCTPPRRHTSIIPQAKKTPRNGLVKFTGFSQTSTYKQRFIFSECSVTEGGTAGPTAPDSTNIGTIVVQITRIELSDNRFRLQSTKVQPVALPPLIVRRGAESKGDIVHGVGLGRRRYSPARLQEFVPVEIRKEIVATFVFRYRPLDILQSTVFKPSNRILAADTPEVCSNLGKQSPKPGVRGDEPPWIDLTAIDESKDDTIFLPHVKHETTEEPDSRPSDVKFLRAPSVSLPPVSAQVPTPPSIATGSVDAGSEVDIKPLIDEERSGSSTVGMRVQPIDLTLDADSDMEDCRNLGLSLAPVESNGSRPSPRIDPIDLTSDEDVSTGVLTPSNAPSHAQSTHVGVKKEEHSEVVVPTATSPHIIDLTCDEDQIMSTESTSNQPKKEEEEEDSIDERNSGPKAKSKAEIEALKAEIRALESQLLQKRKRLLDDSDGRVFKKEVKLEDGCFSASM